MPVLLLLLLLVTGCVRAPLTGPEQALRPVAVPELNDDLPLGLLLAAIEAEIRFLEDPAAPPLTGVFRIGDRRYTRQE